MTSLNEFAAVTAPLPETPKGYEPLVDVTQDGGQAKNIRAPEGANDRELLVASGLDPDSYVISKRRHKRWQFNGAWQSWWAFDFEPRTSETPEERAADLREIEQFLRKPGKPTGARIRGDAALVIPISDLQLGKNTNYTVEAFKRAVERVPAHVRSLRSQGVYLDTLVLAGTGDIIENCDGHYPQQTFVVDLNLRDQVKVARRLIVWAIETLSPAFDNVVVTCVGGNHGENRKNGKSFTDFADNWDVAVFEFVEEFYHGRPGSEKLKFHIPESELSVCVDVKGVPVGFTHGHLASKGGTLPQAKQMEWWKGQFWGGGPVSKAQILVTSHFHHLTVSNWGERTHLQTPAFDGGSRWWTDMTGLSAADGLMTFVVDRNYALGWDHLRVF